MALKVESKIRVLAIIQEGSRVLFQTGEATSWCLGSVIATFVREGKPMCTIKHRGTHTMIEKRLLVGVINDEYTVPDQIQGWPVYVVQDK
jgi:hypothetical protein